VAKYRTDIACNRKDMDINKDIVHKVMFSSEVRCNSPSASAIGYLDGQAVAILECDLICGASKSSAECKTRIWIVVPLVIVHTDT
jgi:hypothetical protein